MSKLIGSILPIGVLELPDGDKVYRSTHAAVVATKEIERPDQLSKAGFGRDWKTAPIPTSEVRDGYDLPFDDKMRAQKTVKAFGTLGYVVLPADNLPDLSSFTKEEMTVTLHNHFNLKRITQ